MLTNEQQAIILSRTIQGAPSRDIAAEIGVAHSTVLRARSKPDMRAKIESEAEAIINRGLRSARRTICRLAAVGNAKGQDKDMLKLSLDASKHITAIAGLSGNSTSTIINTLININEAPREQSELSGLAKYMTDAWQCANIPHNNDNTVSKIPHNQGNMENSVVKKPHCDGQMVSVAAPHTPAQVSAQPVIDIDPANCALDSPTVDNPVDNPSCPPLLNSVHK